MADGDGAAVDVEPVVGDAEPVAAVDDLHRERLVQLPESDVIDLEARPLQEARDGEDGADAHFVRLAARHCEPTEDPQRPQAAARSQLRVHHHAGGSAVGELAGIAGRHDAARDGRLDLRDRLDGGVGTDPLVDGQRHLARRETARLFVGDAGQRGERDDLVGELPGCLRRSGSLLAARTVLVHRVAADVVALGHLLGGLQHAPVDLGLVLDEPGVVEHVLVQLLLHAGDRLDAARHHHRHGIDDHALRGDGDGLQPRGAEAVHRGAGGGHGEPSAQRDLPGHVSAGGPLGQRATHDHVLDFGRIDLRPLHCGADDVGADGGAVGHVERAAPGLRQAGAGGGDDRCVGHYALPDALNDFPSAASFASSGAGSQAAGSPCGFFASRRMDRTTL